MGGCEVDDGQRSGPHCVSRRPFAVKFPRIEGSEGRCLEAVAPRVFFHRKAGESDR